MPFTKRDTVFCMITLLLAGCFCMFVYTNAFSFGGESVEIFRGNERISTHSLKIDQMIDLSDENVSLVLEIKDGTVFVRSSACASQDCVHTPPISKSGQVILCAPQQILIRISASQAPDAVVS